MSYTPLSSRATLKAIAAQAGVSTATVSRAFSSPEKVSPAALQRVNAALTELGYPPGLNQRYAGRARTRMLLILVPDICDPFFPAMIRGIEQTAAAAGYLTLIMDCAYQNIQETDLPSKLLTRQFDGILLLGSQLPTLSEWPHPDQLPPLVLANEFSADPGLPAVHIDNLTAAFNAVSWLLDNGLQRIACLTGPENMSHCRYRRQGYIEALRRRDIPVSPQYLLRGDFSFAAGQQALNTLMTLPQPPQAIFCHNDQMALGVLHQAALRGIAIPDQLQVIGFDDIDAARYSYPPLTTVTQPRPLIGSEAASLLIDIIEGKTLSSGSRLLEASLTLRGSTRARSATD